ncbi:MAG: hypothetical protein HQL52_09415 [Magnetococcales bacterium]|nr:hypothetical protein [Magnetococcales bacterium]
MRRTPHTNGWIRGFLAGLCLLATALPSGCAPPPPEHPMVSQPLSSRTPQNLTSAAYEAADAMLARLGDRIHPKQTILPASFVDQDDLNKSSRLGRLLARQMASRFTQAGLPVVEVKLRNSILIQEGKGEFLLSRELDAIQADHNVHAVLVGSYAVAGSKIFVNAQLIRLKDRVILSSQDFTVPMGNDTRALVAENKTY